LVTNLNILKKLGHNLELYVDPKSKQTGRQFICKGNGGRIDLLCYDKTLKRYVVIELKNVRAGQNTFGQISNYVGWVQDRIAGNLPVIGLVISRGYDTRFESALKITDKISHIDVEKDLGFVVAPTKKIQDIIQPIPKDASPVGIKFAKTREAKTWLKKGDNLFDEAKYDEAIACYDMALGKDPKNKWAWINKGSALSELSKYQDTISCFNKVAKIYPKSAQVWDSKGIALSRLNKFEEAIDAFDRVIELKPKLADPWNSKGFVLYNLKN
jgi:tetratricopeptide (TPR) repeat protein